MKEINPKEIIVGVLAVVSGGAAFWFWYTAIPKIISGSFANYSNAYLPLGLLVIAAVFFAMAAVFIKSTIWVYAILFGSMGGAYFLLPAISPVLVSLTACLVFIFSAVYRIRAEAMLSLGFHPSKILKGGMAVYFTASALVISTFFYMSLDEDRAISTLLPEPVFQAAFPAILNYLNLDSALPSIGPDSTIDDALTSVIKDQLIKQGIPESRISAKEISAAVKIQRDELGRRYGITLTGKERIADAFYRLTSNQLVALVGPYRSYLPAVSALTFFFAFKVLTIPLYYVTMAVVILLIKVLEKFKILKRQIVSMDVERLTL